MEINRRTAAENEFVVLKKVRVGCSGGREKVRANRLPQGCAQGKGRDPLGSSVPRDSVVSIPSAKGRALGA